MYEVMFRCLKSSSCITLSITQNKKCYFNNATIELLESYGNSFFLLLVPQCPYTLCVRKKPCKNNQQLYILAANNIPSRFLVFFHIYCHMTMSICRECQAYLLYHGNPKLFLNFMCSLKNTATVLTD